MRQYSSPIHASSVSPTSSSVKIKVTKTFSINSISHQYIIGRLKINFVPAPKDNPVIFRQYELTLPSTFQIVETKIPSKLIISKHKDNNNNIKITVKPRANILIIDKPLSIVLTTKILPVKSNSQYVIFAIPRTNNDDQAINKYKSINNIILNAPISNDYTGIAIVNNKLFISETIHTQKLFFMLPEIMITVLFSGLVYGILILYTLILLATLIVYNIIWIRRQILKYL